MRKPKKAGEDEASDEGERLHGSNPSTAAPATPKARRLDARRLDGPTLRPWTLRLVGWYLMMARLPEGFSD